MKILIIRVGRVGDMLMITPAVRALMDTYPEAEFHMLTGVGVGTISEQPVMPIN